MKVLHLPFLCLVLFGQLDNVQGQAKLINPPSRSSMWRYGFSTPRNTNDNRLNCGGINALKANDGRCGICGDHFSRLPRPNEDGGRYATRTIGKTYDQGQIVPFTVEFNIGQKGYFEFRLCSLQPGVFEATQACLDENLLPLVNGTTRMYVPATRFKKTTFQLVLPANLTCERCVVQWIYVTSHTWGCVPSEKECCFGCGIQEKYVNCADVKIKSTAATTKPTTTVMPPSTTKRPTPTRITTRSTTTSSQIPIQYVPSTTNSPNPAPPISTTEKIPASTTVSASQVHIEELLATQRAQLMELARLRKKIADMASSQPETTTETTTKALPTTTPARSGEPQNLQEFVQAFLSVTEKIHGNVPNSPSAMMEILRNVPLFEPVSTTPAPSKAEQFLETVLFPSIQAPTTTPPPLAPPAPPAPPPQPQVQSVLSSQTPRVNPFLQGLPSTNQFPPVYPQSMGSNQMMPSMQSMQSMQAMNADLLGLNAEAQSMFEMQGNPLLGEATETGLGGVMNPIALMTQMLFNQQQMPAAPAQTPATFAAPTLPAQRPVVNAPALTPQKPVAPLVVIPAPSPVTVFTPPVKTTPEPLTLDTLSDLQRSEILQKLKMANLILSKQAQPMSMNEKLKIYRMVIDKALLTFNREREEMLAKSSPLVLTEITQNNHLLNQQKQIETLQQEIQRLKNQTQSMAVSRQPSAPVTQQVPRTSLTENRGNEPPVSREPNTPADIEPRRPVIPGTNVVHPLHSKPVDFTNVDPFTLMGLGAMGGAGLLEPLIKCKFIGAGELEWACKRFCIPDVGDMSCSARPEFPQHKTKCAQDCAVL